MQDIVNLIFLKTEKGILGIFECIKMKI